MNGWAIIIEKDADYPQQLAADIERFEREGYMDDAANHREWLEDYENGDTEAYGIRLESIDPCGHRAGFTAHGVWGVAVSARLNHEGEYLNPEAIEDSHLRELAYQLLTEASIYSVEPA